MDSYSPRRNGRALDKTVSRSVFDCGIGADDDDGMVLRFDSNSLIGETKKLKLWMRVD